MINLSQQHSVMLKSNLSLKKNGLHIPSSTCGLSVAQSQDGGQALDCVPTSVSMASTESPQMKVAIQGLLE